MPDTIEDARRLIESRLAEIEGEARTLGRALSGLGGRSRRSSSRPAKSEGKSLPPGAGPRRTVAGRKTGKRAARGQRRDELLAAVKASPGARPSELAKAMGVRPTQVSVLIAKARAEKLIVKRGQGYAPR